MSVTEADICRAYEGLARTVSAKTGGIERDDAISVAELGVLKAIRTWRSGMCDFRGYAEARARQELSIFKRCIGRQARGEARLSLDEPLGHERSGATYGDVLAIIEADFTIIDVGMFIRALAHKERLFVRLRMYGYDNGEIARLFQESPEAVEVLHRTVMRKATVFFDI